MSRRSFFQIASAAGLHAALSPLTAEAAPKARMPVLFIGHGSPMNAVSQNDFTRALAAMPASLPRPKAILAISAHWQTPGQTLLDAQATPPTIHDFRGFPPALSSIEYPAAGAPGLARELTHTLKTPAAEDTHWGLDHGTWSVLVHMYPKADIPVVQLSIDANAQGPAHYALGRELAYLREHGVLILASGGIVHNLRLLDQVPDAKGAHRPWAEEFDQNVAQALRTRDDLSLQHYDRLHPQAALAVPTPDHYWPLLYALGAAAPHDPVSFPFEGFQLGTLSMRCVRFG